MVGGHPADGHLSEDLLRSAEEAFARVMSGVAEQVETMPPDLEAADALRWAGDRTTEMLAGLAELPLDRLLGLADRSVDGRDHDNDPGVSDRAAPRGEPLVVRAARGSVAETRVWVHLIGQPPATTLRFSLSDLVGPEGNAWAGNEVVFTPAAIVLPAPTAASVLLRLTIPDGVPPGEHHGLIIGRGVTGAVVPITVVIT
jgi:hypothetical protein